MVSTVSTRGVKFKFSIGEHVLCYEPDPTKAKVLYDSRVLDLVVSRDERGRKIPEYLIHFSGWNKSWDRCVKEEFILPLTEENRDLQTKLATEVAPTLKGKRKIKLPPLIKETLAKKQCAEAGKLENEKNEDTVDSSSDTDSSDEEVEREVTINIPEVLKKQLEEDYKNITKRNKLVKLPCKPNVISILEAFVKHLAAKLLCVYPPKNAKNGKQLMPEDVQNKLNLCKEAMDGVRIYFDFTFHDLLLYNQEKDEYYSDFLKCTPISSFYKWEPQESVENVVVKLERLEPEVAFKNNTVPVIKVELENILPNRTQNKKILRSQSTLLIPSLKVENITNGETEKKLINSETIKKEENKKNTRERQSYATTRVLRSTEKQKLEVLKEDPDPKPPENSPPPLINNNNSNKRLTPTFPTLTISLEHTNMPRITRKSTLQNMSPPRICSPASPTLATQPFSENKTNSNSSVPHAGKASFTPLPSNCISSSNSSSYSTFSNPTVNPQFHLINTEALLQEILSWRLIPEHLHDSIPSAPSLIFGAQHLLRLYVKFPELLSKMNISKKKIAPLLEILESLLKFIMEKSNELFLPSAYIENDYEEENICVV